MKNKIWSKNNLEYKKMNLFEFCFTITFMSIGCLYCNKEGVKNNALFSVMGICAVQITLK